MRGTCWAVDLARDSHAATSAEVRPRLFENVSDAYEVSAHLGDWSPRLLLTGSLAFSLMTFLGSWTFPESGALVLSPQSIVTLLQCCFYTGLET